MTLAQSAVSELRTSFERFSRSTKCLPESLSTFSPSPNSMTTAQQVAHVARVIDWFLEGAFRPEGFDLDFSPQIESVLVVESLHAARVWFERSSFAALECLARQSNASLQSHLPDGPVLGGQPRFSIVNALIDHTAHHRGTLTVYARLHGIAPPDPYFE